jgi:GNAT superfamily N-acetyltransferase
MSTVATPADIRPLAPADRQVWEPLWRDYLAFYETELPAAVYDSTFARLTSGDPREFRGLLAWQGDRAVGLAHYLFHRSCWKIEDSCYLQDLFVSPDLRGGGVGRALIAAVGAAAEAAGNPGVWWLTQEFNYRGRMLYDKVGVRTPFIRYDRRRA